MRIETPLTIILYILTSCEYRKFPGKMNILPIFLRLFSPPPTTKNQPRQSASES